MNYGEIIDYFKSLAISHKDIRHSKNRPRFFHGDREQWTDLIDEVPAGEFFMICDYITNQYHDVFSNNIGLVPFIEVTIAFKASEEEIDYDKEVSLIGKAQDINFQILIKIRDEFRVNRKFAFFKIADAKSFRVWKERLQNCTGWMTEIPLRVKPNKFNPDEVWQ